MTEALLAAVFDGPMGWRVHAARLYLYTGRYMPKEAKEHGLYLGFCDPLGRQRGRFDPDATHIGWTAAPSPLQLPVPWVAP